jgi:hypothetical protein
VARRTFDLVRLEDRTAPAVFTVTTTDDNGNDLGPTAGSFREAILNANATAGADSIVFSVGGAGVRTIALTAALPTVTDAVLIDATTQPGYAGTPLVEIDGTALTIAANGLLFFNHTGSSVRGLGVGGFKAAGIRLDGGGSHVLAANYVGADANGTVAIPNGVGVLILNGSSSNTVGGVTAAELNVISGNLKAGVRIANGATGNTVAGNFLGTTANGSLALGNGTHGVELTTGATGNTVGGTTAGSGNIIAGNASHGVRLADGTTAGNLIAGNRVGVGFNGLGLPNAGDGVRAEAAAGSAPAGGLSAANANFVTKNTIASSAGNGVGILDTARLLRLEQNGISNNGLLGIARDATANNGQPAPVIADVVTTANGITVTGTATGPANAELRIEIFGNAAADPSGFGEGQTFLNAVTVTTDASGQAPFSVSGATTSVVSATATAVATGDSSAFSEVKTKSGGTTPQFLSRFAVGTGAGAQPVVNVYEPNGTLAFSVAPFSNSFTGGVRVAMADVNGDAALDLIVGTGPGIPTNVKIYDGKTQQVLFTVDPYESSFIGGVFVSGGDMDGDGKAEFAISPDEGGGPRVRVFRGGSFTQLVDFFGIEDPNFRGGARTAIGDLNNDDKGDLAVAAGFGGGPRVALFNGALLTASQQPKFVGDFFVYEETLRNGSFPAIGDLNNNGFAELIVGGGPGGGPRVQALDGQALTTTGTLVPLANYFAGDPNNRGGIRVASRLVTGDNLADIVTGDGDGTPGTVRLFAGNSLLGGSFAPTLSLSPFGSIPGGVFVG